MKREKRPRGTTYMYTQFISNDELKIGQGLCAKSRMYTPRIVLL